MVGSSLNQNAELRINLHDLGEPEGNVCNNNRAVSFIPTMQAKGSLPL